MTPEQIDKLWNRALAESVAAGEEFTRYRFAAMVESAAVRRCAEIVRTQNVSNLDLSVKRGPFTIQTDATKSCAENLEAAIKAEFPGAFE